MRTRDHLTDAQRAALIVLSDGKEHETWRRSSGGQVIQRVNHNAAASLAMMGLVRCRYSPGRQQYATATENGLLVARAELGAHYHERVALEAVPEENANG